MKTVKYDGYQATVPDSWPVFNLDENPQQCVRYDINAVYLGTPGSNQDCPPELIGRADTITIGGPAGPGVHTNSPVQPTATRTGDDVRSAAEIDGHQVSVPTSSASGTIFSDSDLRELALTMPASAPGINATYGSDVSVSAQALASVRLVTARTTAGVGEARHPAMYQASNPAWPASQGTSTGPFTAWNVPAPASSSQPNSAPLPWITSTATPTVTPKVTPKVSLTPIPIGGSTTKSAKPVPGTPVPAKPTPAPAVTGKPAPPVTTTGSASAMAGFDTCTAPSVAAMKAWKAKYSATIIYIGGQMMACGYGNLSASWVKQVEAMGWSLMPTFVGLQAPCNSFIGKISASSAASQGASEANMAITDAQKFGLGTGTPIYYDMEAYDDKNASCKTAVLTFLDSWDRQLTAKGYVPGVYSSAASGITDLQSAKTIAGHALDEPQAVWFALWDNQTTLTGSPYMSTLVWPVANRSKQYAGNRVVKVGSYSLQIDADWVASAVAR